MSSQTNSLKCGNDHPVKTLWNFWTPFSLSVIDALEKPLKATNTPFEAILFYDRNQLRYDLTDTAGVLLVGYNKEQHVFLINFKYMTILLKRGVLVALKCANHSFLISRHSLCVRLWVWCCNNWRETYVTLWLNANDMIIVSLTYWLSVTMKHDWRQHF